MKKVLILGANGHTSQEIIPRLLNQDNIGITLFIRNMNDNLTFIHPKINYVQGDALNINDLKKAMQGQNIIVSTLGGMDLDIKTSNIIQAMQYNSIERLIAINAGGIYDELPEPFNSWDKKMVGYTRPINLKAANLIESSQLQYTILRPIWLTNKPIETFELTYKGEPFKGTETSRASIAKIIVDIIKDPSIQTRKNIGISQPNTDGTKPLAYQ
ncbi:SDR family oxidoreductase [Acinetobacter pollinis]|uniref:SDR family oxidoreductase n=1 Tax=Acinetobacter pollinis TaxID=2605270 RepID=UPI0018A25660|nr:SDR family oxidoreductase [Acinetobacter pollinis]MBF7690875.1 SDR family oxidoreductase [Acinetobacter pollinis]MBF7697353.1 SDR family oxidoreductase [Acinetobacter pollinis]